MHFISIISINVPLQPPPPQSSHNNPDCMDYSWKIEEKAENHVDEEVHAAGVRLQIYGQWGYQDGQDDRSHVCH